MSTSLKNVILAYPSLKINFSPSLLNIRYLSIKKIRPYIYDAKLSKN